MADDARARARWIATAPGKATRATPATDSIALKLGPAITGPIFSVSTIRDSHPNVTLS